MKAFLTRARPYWPLWAVVTWGVVLRIWYFAVTPFHLRAYDTGEHLDYIVHVMNTFQLPAIGSGWEAHQPPLYYFLMGGWAKFLSLFGITVDHLPYFITSFSLLFSLATLPIAAWVSLVVFPKPAQRLQATIFLLVPAILPSIVFLSSRISNDTLVFPLSLIWLGLFFRWQQTRDETMWFWACLALGIAMLAKLSMVPLIPVMALELLLTKGMTTKTKTKLLVTLGVTIALLSGWHIFLRTFGGYAEFMFVKGSGAINKLLIMKIVPFNYFTFNPLVVLQAPYANPWMPGPMRDGFWEYFFRSAFTGEWLFPKTIWLNRGILLLAMLAVPVAVTGAIRTWKMDRAFGRSLLLMFVFLCMFLVTFQIKFPCACLQDFRYVPLVAIVAGIWFATGFPMLKPPLKKLAVGGAFLLAVLCSLFLFSLPFFPS
jgi:hypothetical protein